MRIPGMRMYSVSIEDIDDIELLTLQNMLGRRNNSAIASGLAADAQAQAIVYCESRLRDYEKLPPEEIIGQINNQALCLQYSPECTWPDYCIVD